MKNNDIEEMLGKDWEEDMEKLQDIQDKFVVLDEEPEVIEKIYKVNKNSVEVGKLIFDMALKRGKYGN